jgi:charged multivesicular body protein 5
MHRFFGAKQKKKTGKPDPTLSDVSGSMDKRVVELEKKIKRLERQIMELKKKMSKSRGATKNSYKQKALKLLKQKKQYENQRDRLMGQQMNIDSAKFATESIQDNQQMVAAMKATATTLKQQFKEINIDEVEDLQDEMQDLMEDANEINDILGEAWGMDDFDEDDLLGELDEFDADLDDLDMDDEEVPSYMVSAASASNKNELENNSSQVDEYGLPRVPQQLVQ